MSGFASEIGQRSVGQRLVVVAEDIGNYIYDIVNSCADVEYCHEWWW